MPAGSERPRPRSSSVRTVMAAMPASWWSSWPSFPVTRARSASPMLVTSRSPSVRRRRCAAGSMRPRCSRFTRFPTSPRRGRWSSTVLPTGRWCFTPADRSRRWWPHWRRARGGGRPHAGRPPVGPRPPDHAAQGGRGADQPQGSQRIGGVLLHRVLGGHSGRLCSAGFWPAAPSVRCVEGAGRDAADSALLSVAVTCFADIVFGTLVGHWEPLFLALWLYVAAVCLTVRGVAALVGLPPSIVLILLLIALGNPSRAAGRRVRRAVARLRRRSHRHPGRARPGSSLSPRRPGERRRPHGAARGLGSN